MLVPIQPEPFLQELNYLVGSDGFMDRMLVIAAKPALTLSRVRREAGETLNACRMKDFTEVFDRMLNDHEGGITYKLDEKANQLYDDMCDSYAIHIMQKYNSDVVEDEDSASRYSTPKDMTHLLKIAACLHVFCRLIRT